MYFCNFVIIFPSKNAWSFIWRDLPRDALFQVWLNIALCFLKRKFSDFFNAILLFRYYLPLKNGVILHLEVYPIHLRMLWAKFGWNWLSDSFYNFASIFIFWFACVEVFVPLENFSLIWRRHHCRWRAANFDLCSALVVIEQWGFFSVSHLLWHRTSV